MVVGLGPGEILRGQPLKNAARPQLMNYSCLGFRLDLPHYLQ